MNIARVTAVLLIVQFVEGKNSCSNSKLVVKYIERFASQNDEESVVEAKYDSMEGQNYRFVLSENWKSNNGGLNYIDEIIVNAEAAGDVSTTACFDDLDRKDNYLLILSQNGDTFIPKLAPLSIKKHARRNDVRTAWCNSPHNECPLQISRHVLPSVVELFRGMNTLLKCRVSSKTPITSIRWLKDGKDVVEYGGEIYAENGIYVLRENLQRGSSELVIYRSSGMHSGVYTCVVTNEAGETTKRNTRVSVGPEPRLFGECPAWAEGYCHAGSTCRSIVDLPNEIVCECGSGRTGARCHRYDVELQGTASANKELTAQIQGLKIVAVLLGVVLLSSLVVLAFVSISLRQKERATTRTTHHYIERPNERALSLAKAEMGIGTNNT